MTVRAQKSVPTSPAMQFYVRDWITSTYGMGLEEKGFYVDLLCFSWDNGALPDDAKWRQRVAGVSAPKAAALWAILRKRWRKTRKGWINPRLERQRQQLSMYQARAEHASSMRWSNAKPDAKRMLNASTSSSSSSSSSDLNKPAAPRPVPFRVYAAIARKVLAEPPGENLSDLTEAVKTAYAQQGLPYDSTLVHKALNAAEAARLRKRA